MRKIHTTNHTVVDEVAGYTLHCESHDKKGGTYIGSEEMYDNFLAALCDELTLDTRTPHLDEQGKSVVGQIFNEYIIAERQLLEYRLFSRVVIEVDIGKESYLRGIRHAMEIAMDALEV